MDVASSRSLYIRGNTPLEWRLSGSHSRSGHRGGEEKKISCPWRESNPDSSVVQPVTHRYTVRVILAPQYRIDSYNMEVVKLLHRPHVCNFSHTCNKFHTTSVGMFTIYFQGRYYTPSYDGWLVIAIKSESKHKLYTTVTSLLPILYKYWINRRWMFCQRCITTQQFRTPQVAPPQKFAVYNRVTESRSLEVQMYNIM